MDVTCKHCSERVQEALFGINVSTNNDNPEGGLDALLQVAACPEVCQSGNSEEGDERWSQ